jgi:hypothetical protein
MIGALASLLLLAQTSSALDNGLSCSASFADGVRSGFLSLWVDREYRTRSMGLTLSDQDGWTRSQVTLDPIDRKLPGVLSSFFFFVRFERKPTFPLTMNAYADGTLRWKKSIAVPFVPTSSMPNAAPYSGTADYLGRADDGLPVSTPRELKIILMDAKERPVGTLRYPIFDDATQVAALKAIAQLETSYKERSCTPPPPLID